MPLLRRLFKLYSRQRWHLSASRTKLRIPNQTGSRTSSLLRFAYNIISSRSDSNCRRRSVEPFRKQLRHHLTKILKVLMMIRLCTAFRIAPRKDFHTMFGDDRDLERCRFKLHLIETGESFDIPWDRFQCRTRGGQHLHTMSGEIIRFGTEYQ